LGAASLSASAQQRQNMAHALEEDMEAKRQAWDVVLQETFAAIAEAQFLNHAVASGQMSPEEAIERAASNPMLEAVQSPAIRWDEAQLLDEGDVLRTATVEGPMKNEAELNVEHSRAGNVNKGDAFTVRVLFNLPKYAGTNSFKQDSFVRLARDNRWKFYKSPKGERQVEFSADGRSASVLIRLQQADSEAKNNYLMISIHGTYGNGDPFFGQASLHLVTKEDLPRPKPIPKIP
jgi:hypothetical protein